MDIKQVLSSNTTPSTNISKVKKSSEKVEKHEKEVQEAPAAVYEKSEEVKDTKSTKVVDRASIDKMIEDAKEKTATLRNIVTEMLTKQGITVNESNFYEILREGNYEVSEEVKTQAQKDIAEDGYYGVEQTSDRIVSFAKALAGGDSSKADLMIEAVLQGFEEATKEWGDTLPEISHKTLEAATKKLEAWKNESVTE